MLGDEQSGVLKLPNCSMSILWGEIKIAQRGREMKFSDSEYEKAIGHIPIADIAKRLYIEGWRQSSSRYATLTNQLSNETMTECGNALVKAVRKIERKGVTDANRIQTDQNP